VCLTVVTVALLVLVVFVQFASYSPVAEQNAPTNRPLLGFWMTVGDWTIENNDDITHKDKTIRLNGDLDVESGGKLTLINVKLEVNSLSRANPHAITVESGGELIMEGCNVTEYLATNFSQPDYYQFVIAGDASINDTEISYLWSQDPNEGGVQLNDNGLQIEYTDDVYITNCTIYEASTTAVHFDQSDAVLFNTTIYNSIYAVVSMNSDPMIIGNEIHNVTTGVYIRNSNSALVKDNYLHHNRNGVDLGQASIKVINNTFTDHHLEQPYPLVIWPSRVMNLRERSDAEVAYNTLKNNDQFQVEIDSCAVEFHHNYIDGDEARTEHLVQFNFGWGSYIHNNTIKNGFTNGLYGYWLDGVKIDDNTITDCGDYGIYLDDSYSVKMERNVLTDNRNGLYMRVAYGGTLTNCSISSEELDMYLTDTGTIYSYNSTFDPNSVYIWDEWNWGTELHVYWLINIHLADKLNLSLPGYNVTLDPYGWGGTYYYGKTDANGDCKNIWLKDYEIDYWWVNSVNPYYVQIWNDENSLWDTTVFDHPGWYNYEMGIYTPGPPGDWIINSTEYYNDTHLDENFLKPDNNYWIGNLTIQKGGKLILDNVSLELQSTSSMEYDINVDAGGELILRNCSVFSKFNSTSSPYDFVIEGKAELYQSKINYTDSGVIILYNDNVSVDHCIIQNSDNGLGIGLAYCDPSITNNTISVTDVGIGSYGYSNPFIYNNDLKNAVNGIYLGGQSFGTILFNNIYNNGGNGIHLESSSPLIKNNYIYGNGGNGIYANNSHAKIFANNIYNNDFSGVYLDGNNGATVELNDLYDNSKNGLSIAGAQDQMAYSNILGNNIYGNDHGISIDAGSAFLDANDIHNNTRYGITASNGATPNIWANNTIRYNQHGVYMDSSAGLIRNANISQNTNTGIYLVNSAPGIHNISLYHNILRGIYAYSGSEPLIYNNMIEMSDKGIEAYSSSPRIEACEFDNNNHSIYMTSASPIIGNSTFHNANTKHFYLSVSYPKSVDNVFPSIYDVYLSEPMSQFYYSWFADVKVIDDKFNPLQNATVQILDQATSKVLDGMTDSKGFIWGVLLHEYSIQDNNNDKDGADWAISMPENTDLTPHNITASYKGFQNTSKIVTMDKCYLKSLSNEIIIQMQKPGGGGGSHDPPTMPTNILPNSTHSLQPNITWDASTDYSGLGIQYHFTLLDELGAKVYDDLILTNNFFLVDSNLSYGDGYNPYTIEIFAEDGDNYTSDIASDTMGVFNTDPVLDGIGDKNLTEDETLSFTISATDSDINPTDILIFGTNATSLALNAASGAVSWTPGAADVGNHTVNFTVTDSIGGWDFEVINIWVKPKAPNFNNPPFADAGQDDTSLVNESFKLNGTASFDPDNDTLDYHWEVDHKNYTFTIPNNAEPSFTPNETGVWTIKLRVKDVNGTSSLFSGYDEMNLTVINNTPPVAVIDEPLNNTVFGLGDTVDFNATSSSDVNTHQILSYKWYTNNTGTIENRTQIGEGVIFNTTALLQGLHTITLEVSDSHDAMDVASIWLEVAGPTNQPPVLLLQHPKEGWSYNKSVFFDATGTTDPELDPLQYTWFRDTDILLKADDKKFDMRLPMGEQVITLYVSDGINNVSASVNIIVTNRHPSVEFDHNGPKSEGEVMTFDASLSTDPEGKQDEENFTYTWEFGEDGSGSGMIVNHTFKTFGEYNITLTIDDGSENNATAEAWEVIYINAPPVPEAGEDQSAMMNDLLEFDASGTTDADDEYKDLDFSWDFGDGFFDTGDQVTHTYSQSGTFTVELTVTDGVAIVNDTLEVIIEGVGQPPVADPGTDRTEHFEEFAPLEVFFDSSRSYDPADDTNGNGVIDGNELNNLTTYLWDFGDDSNNTQMSPSHTFETLGTFTVTLYVTNDMGLMANRSVRIELNYIPVAGLEVDQYALANTDVNLDASLSYDSSGSIATYSWDFGDGTTDSGTKATTTHKYTQAGTFTIKLNVTDNKGATSLSVDVKVEIIKLSTPSIDSHSDGGDVTEAKIITISGSASAPSKGSYAITQVMINFGGDKWYRVNNDGGDWTSWSYEWGDSGNHTGKNITIRVKSYSGSSQSDVTSITVSIKEKSSDDKSDSAIIIIVVVVVLLLAIVIVLVIFFILRGRNKGGGAEEYYEEGSEEDAEEAPAEKPKFKLAPGAGTAAAKKTPPTQSRPAASKAAAARKPQVKEQPIKCPKCTELFIVKDNGRRPLRTKCTNCGAKGLIRGDSKPPEPEKLNIKCPKCTRIFKITGDEKYFECPKCHTKGTLSDTVVDKIRDKLGKSVSPLGAAFAGLDRKKVPKETIRCPVCRDSFEHPEDEKKIECPSCGAKGSM